MPGIDRTPRQLESARIWQRQPAETEKAYIAFKAFMDEGEGRTIVAAYRTLTSNPDAPRAPTWWHDWVSCWSWYKRVQAYETYKQDEVIEREVQARLEARRLRRQSSQGLLHLGMMGLKKHKDRLERKKRNADEVQIAPLREYITAVQIGIEQNRKEWDEEPVQRVQQATALQAHIRYTPEDIAKLDAATLVGLYQQLGDPPKQLRKEGDE